MNVLQKLWHKFNVTPTKKFGITAACGFCGCLMVTYFTFLHILFSGSKREFAQAAFRIFVENKKLTEMLGEPVKMGHVYATKDGSITQDEADAIIPVRGKKYDGILKVVADKNKDKWRVKKLEFEFLDEGGGKLRLVQEIGDEEDKKF